MGLKKLLHIFALTLLSGSLLCATSSCSDDDTDNGSGKSGRGQITGTVTDDYDAPLAGVVVTVEDSEMTATTSTDGTYTLADMPIGTYIITFSKANYQTTSVTVTAKKFNDQNIAAVNATMEYAAAKIVGTITDAKNGGAPLPGVTVSLSESLTTVSGSDGQFAIENLPLDAYTVTFTLDGYASVTRKVGMDAFEDGVVTINLLMGGREILRGKTLDDLNEADTWYYNEYRGGGNGDAYPHWDWSTDYMASLTFEGAWEEQNEGTTLQIRNHNDADKSNPAELNIFDSYTYGKKHITDDNKILSLRVRTHAATADAPCYYGVQVVDMTAAEPEAVKVGENRTLADENYNDVIFDLSDYVGKDVIVAIGTYRAATGDYWKQLVLRRIAFAQEAVYDWNWLPGTAINDDLKNWALTQEMVRSTLPQTKKSFSGVTVCEGDHGKDNRQNCYQAWRDNAHIGAEWTFVPLHKDPEPFAGEGFVIKTRGGVSANTTEPESYFYAKFPIAAGCNRFTLKARTFGSTDAFFKLTAITEDNEVVYVQPVEHSADTAEAAADGCWKMHHDSGDAGSPADYATFTYDLSQFNGKNVVLALGVFKGEQNDDENKIAIYSIDLN